MRKTNLGLWDRVEKTDPKKTKKATKGKLSLTAINATSQIKTATEMFGRYGETWGLRHLNYEYMDIDTTKLAILSCEFYYPNGSFEIGSSIKVAYKTNGANGYLKIDDDFVKKLETDATTKALSKLGFNADVFMGYYDDNKYVTQMNEHFHPTPKPMLDDKGFDFLTSDKAKKEHLEKALKEREMTAEQREKLGSIIKLMNL